MKTTLEAIRAVKASLGCETRREDYLMATHAMIQMETHAMKTNLEGDTRREE